MVLEADTLLEGISELVTFRDGPYRRVSMENAGIIRDAVVALKGGRIVYAGPRTTAPQIRADVREDLKGRVVTPAFVDSHTHLVFAGDRSWELWMKLEGKSYLEILEAGGGIYYTVKMTRKASASELADQAYPRLVVMAWEGTVHVESKTGYGLTGEHELKMLEAMDLLQVMAPYMGITKTLLAHVVPEEYGDRREEYIEHFTKQLIPAAKEKGAEFVDVFCDRGAFTVEETRRILSAAAAYGMKLRLHSDELADIGCSRLALEYTLYSMDHLEHLPPTIIPALANTRTVATLLPTSMLSVFSEKKPPVEELKKHGVYIGLATDLNPNNMTPSMRHVVELAVYLYKLTPLEALAAATVNAAYSLGLEGVLGRIVEGTNPGLIIWDFDSVKKIGYEWGYDTILAVVRRDGAIVYHY